MDNNWSGLLMNLFSIARCCCGCKTVFTDLFNRGDSSDIGGGWNEVSGEWVISSNHLKCTSTSGRCIQDNIYSDMNVGYFIQAVISFEDFNYIPLSYTTRTTLLKLLFNYVDESNYHFVEVYIETISGVDNVKFTLNDISSVLSSGFLVLGFLGEDLSHIIIQGCIATDYVSFIANTSSSVYPVQSPAYVYSESISVLDDSKFGFELPENAKVAWVGVAVTLEDARPSIFPTGGISPGIGSATFLGVGCRCGWSPCYNACNDFPTNGDIKIDVPSDFMGDTGIVYVPTTMTYLSAGSYILSKTKISHCNWLLTLSDITIQSSFGPRQLRRSIRVNIIKQSEAGDAQGFTSGTIKWSCVFTIGDVTCSYLSTVKTTCVTPDPPIQLDRVNASCFSESPLTVTLGNP